MINLLRRCNTRVMAGRTVIAHYIIIMEKSARECNKGAGTVARRAIQVGLYQIGLYMTNRLATTDRAIMAGLAIAAYPHVAKRCSSKVGGVMANGAILVVGSGRYVVQELTYTNPAVVARITVSDLTKMVIGARAKSPQGMAVATILVTGRTRIVRIGWHVRIDRCGKWFACGSNLWWYRVVIAMARLAVGHNTVMIEAEGRSETLGVMTRSTIGCGYRVGGHRRRLGGRVYTRTIVVAGFTRLYRWVKQAVVEKTTWHFESHDAMA